MVNYSADCKAGRKGYFGHLADEQKWGKGISDRQRANSSYT